MDLHTLLNTARSVVETILGMPTVLLFTLALNVIGFGLKSWTRYPRRGIPPLLLGLSALVMFFVLPRTPAGQMDPNLPYPEVADAIRCVCVGLVIGFFSWLLHLGVLRHWERHVPWSKEGTDETHEKQ